MIAFLFYASGNSILCIKSESGLLRAAYKVEPRGEAEWFSTLYKAQTHVFARGIFGHMCQHIVHRASNVFDPPPFTGVESFCFASPQRNENERFRSAFGQNI